MLFGRFVGTLPRNVNIQNSLSPPPPQEKLISFQTGYAYSRYVFDLLRWQIHDLVHKDGPILESHVQRRHAKLKQTTNYQLQKSIFLEVREISQEKHPLPKKRLSVMTNDLITFC